MYLLKKGIITLNVASNTVRVQSFVPMIPLHFAGNVVRGHPCCPPIILYPMTTPPVVQFVCHVWISTCCWGSTSDDRCEMVGLFSQSFHNAHPCRKLSTLNCVAPCDWPPLYDATASAVPWKSRMGMARWVGQFPLNAIV